MKKILKFIIVIAVLAAVAFGIKSYLFNDTDANQVGELISTKVVTDTIKTTISATGTLEPVDQVEVGTQVSGDIAKINADFRTRQV